MNSLLAELKTQAWVNKPCRQRGSPECYENLKNIDPELANEVFPNGVFAPLTAALLNLCNDCPVRLEAIRKAQEELIKQIGKNEYLSW